MKWEYFIFIVVVVYLSGELITALPSTMVEPTINIPPSALPSTSLQPTINIPPSALPSTSLQPTINVPPSALPSTSLQPTINISPSALPSTSLQPTVNITPPALPSTTRPECQSSTTTRKRKGQAEILSDSLSKNEKVDGKRRRK